MAEAFLRAHRCVACVSLCRQHQNPVAHIGNAERAGVDARRVWGRAAMEPDVLPASREGSTLTNGPKKMAAHIVIQGGKLGIGTEEPPVSITT